MYLSIFLLPFLISLILTPPFIRIGRKYRLIDIAKGDVLKIHKEPIPFLGGLAMLSAVIAGLLGFGFQQGNYDLRIGSIILGSLLIFLLGFWDDLKWKHISQIRPERKFLLLVIIPIVAAAFLVMTGLKINFFPQICRLSGLLTFLYIFVLINAVNYQDGMDGLAGSLVLISLIGFIILALLSGNNFALILSLIFLGAVFGFLIFNFPPAKIFMGDSGAYFLGFLLAVLAALFSKPYNLASFLGPIFIIGLPLFDGVFTNIRRLLHGKSIFLGDRAHFYDRLLKRGISAKKTLLIAYSLQIISVIIGLSMLYLKP